MTNIQTTTIVLGISMLVNSVSCMIVQAEEVNYKALIATSVVSAALIALACFLVAK